MSTKIIQLCLRIFATDLKTFYGLSQLTIKALRGADFMMRPRAGGNGNSERFRSFHRSGAPTGGARGLFHPCGAHGQKAKNSGQGRPYRPPWVEKDRFPRPPGQRRIGVLPKYSTYLILPGIIPEGINHTIKCQPIGLYLPHGYRNIITCTGRDLAWGRVL